jgi:hypothetical protein
MQISRQKQLRVPNSETTIFKKTFCEELMAYFPFPVILVSDTTNMKKTLVCMRNEVKKQ